MAAERITLLHISDTQFGKEHLFGSAGLTEMDLHRDSLYVRLYNDLEGLQRDYGLEPDVIVVSGDLTEVGIKREFEQAQDFLERLAAALNIAEQRVIVVPGNHDINRDLCQSYFLSCKAEEEEPKRPYWPKWKYYLEMFGRFYGAQYPTIDFTLEHPWTLFELPMLRLVIAGLNSTIAESHREADHYGWIGEEQLAWFAEQLSAYESKGWFRIAVLHHNLQRGAIDDNENLRDADDFGRILGPRVNTVLHGHTHNGKLGWLSPNVPVISTGSAAVKPGSRPNEVPNQYQIVRIGVDSVERWGRRYEPDERRWVGDTRISDHGGAWHTSNPVRFVSASFTFPQSAPRTESGASSDESHSTIGLRIDEDDSNGRHGVDYDIVRRKGRRDDFLTHVAEICALRHREASITLFPSHAPPYLRVSVRHDDVARIQPIGVCEDGVSREEVEAFIEGIHAKYRAADPLVASELVYGGDTASEDLVQYASARGVRLLSFLQYQGILDLRSYVDQQTNRLIRDRVYPPALYVPQRFTRLDSDADGDNLLKATIEDLTVSQGRFILILGDFGRGKTFLLHELARRLPSELSHLVPLLIELRALEKAHGLDELIAQHLAAAGIEEIDLRAFRYMLREGRVVLLFDGFDELAFRITYERAAEHLDTLLQAAEGRAKVVVTSRTQHFMSNEQVKTKLGEDVARVPGRRLVALEDFDEPQILAYLVNRFAGNEELARARFDLIRDVRDLLGLSHNPRMLGFIGDLGEDELRQALNRRGEITSAELYRLLLKRWLEHEYERVRLRGAAPTLTVEQRWAAVTGLALQLWQTTDRMVRLSQLTDTTAKALASLAEQPHQVEGDRNQRQVGQQLDREQAAHTVGSGTLLARSDEGSFEFVHQSVMEWLVAEHAANSMLRGESKLEVLGWRDMSPLMTDFLCDLAGRERALSWAASILGAGSTTEPAKRNALLVLDRLEEQLQTVSRLAGQDLRGASLSRRDLSASDLHGTNLTDARLLEANLSGADLRSSRLVGARLDRANLTNADLRESDLTGASLLGAKLQGTQLAGSKLRRAALVGAELDEAALADCDILGAALPKAEATAEVRPPAAPYRAIAVSQESELVAVGADSGLVTVWDFTGKLIRSLMGQRGRVLTVAFSPDGTKIATAGDENTVRLWDLVSGECARMYSGHRGKVSTVAISPDGKYVVTAGENGDVFVWAYETAQLIRSFSGHRGDVVALAYSPDGQEFATASEHGEVRLWNPSGGDAIRTLHLRRTISALAYSPDSQQLAIAVAYVTLYSDATVRLWDLSSGEEAQTIAQGRTSALAFSPDGQVLATAGEDITVRLWDVETGRAIRALPGHRAPVPGVAFSPDGQHLVTAGEDMTVRLWDPASGQSTHTLSGHSRGAVWGVAFSPDGQLLATAGEDMTVRLWNPAGGGSIRTLSGHSGKVWALAFSPDGRELATTANDGAVRLWSPTTGALVGTLTGHRGAVWAVTHSPDGEQLASGGDDGTVRLWKPVRKRPSQAPPTRNRPTHTLTGHQGQVWTVGYSPDGQQLASGGNDGKVCLWNPAEGQSIKNLTGHRGPVLRLMYSPDGKYLATLSDDRTARLWNPSTGEVIHEFPADQRGIWGPAFSPEGRQFATADRHGVAHLWYLGGRRSAWPRRSRFPDKLVRHDSEINVLSFSPNGRYFVTAGSDGIVRVWDPTSAASIHTLLGHRGAVWALAFSPDSKRVATSGKDATIRIWDLALGNPVATFIPLEAGWSVLSPDGIYQFDGDIAGEIWWIAGLRRFEPGELDPFLPAVRRPRLGRVSRSV